MRSPLPFLPLALALACGTDGVQACEDYVAASDACNQAYADANPDGFAFENQVDCDAADALGGDYYQCLADAVEAADCTTQDGYDSINDAVLDCAL